MPSDFEPLSGTPDDCLLCRQHAGIPVWRDAAWRVIRAEDADFPAFYRVIARHHVGEFSDLLAPERARCMDIVCTIERVLIEQLQPTKINLAALGNMVPHLHWHVIARFADDTHFPDPVWAPARRPAHVARLEALRQQLPALDNALRLALAAHR